MGLAGQLSDSIASVSGALVVLWVNFMGLVILLAIPFLITRKEARWTLLSMVFVIPLTLWMYKEFGYSRLLGLPHIIFWTPLLIYLFSRKDRWQVRSTLGGKWILLLICTISISLVMDYINVARGLFGQLL